jgi:hypothetical protein
MHIPVGATRFVGRAALQLRSHAPKILFGVGIVGVVATAAATAYATVETNKLLAEARLESEDVKVCYLDNDGKLIEEKADELKKELAEVWTKFILDTTKAWLPAVGFGVLTIVSLTSSHNILTKRNTALIAAYKSIEQSLNRYRDRVRSELGAERDAEFLHGHERKTVIESDEHGDRAIEVRRAAVTDDGPSGYARWFDDSSVSWSSTPAYNHIFLRAQQNYANDMLRARGHLFLNEVYAGLGLSHTKAGAIVGWVFDRNNENGDNFVDFGFLSPETDMPYDFNLGKNGAILLDFNVDGIIYDKIERPKRN